MIGMIHLCTMTLDNQNPWLLYKQASSQLYPQKTSILRKKQHNSRETFSHYQEIHLVIYLNYFVQA